MFMRQILPLILIATLLCGCVSTQKFNSVKAEVLRLDSELSSAQRRIEELTDRNSDLLSKQQQLLADTIRLSERCAILQSRYNKLLSDGSADAASMLKEIEATQAALSERSRRVEELEAMLRSREEAIGAIRKKVSDALVGFEGKGLTISVRDGKVYVSMEDKLLFRSGSFQIDPQGAQAVQDLAGVLAQNPDINVMVEGHTDDVPYRGSGQLQDNLDLSAKRATTVVRLLLNNKQIDPQRIVAAGRGESLPVARGESAEARAKNRRTEIILTPKLDELMELMEGTTK